MTETVSPWRSAIAPTLSLCASASTLLCCALPAAMVALGAGAAFAGLTSAVPQIVWLAERKFAVLVVATVLLTIAAALLWRARRLPCPADPAAALACARARTFSAWTLGVSAVCLAVGFGFVATAPEV